MEITAYAGFDIYHDSLQTEYQYAISDAIGPIAFQKQGTIGLPFVFLMLIITLCIIKLSSKKASFLL